MMLFLIFSDMSAAVSEQDNQLLFAVQAINIAKAQTAIKNGADVNAVDDDG